MKSLYSRVLIASSAVLTGLSLYFGIGAAIEYKSYKLNLPKSSPVALGWKIEGYAQVVDIGPLGKYVIQRELKLEKEEFIEKTTNTFRDSFYATSHFTDFGNWFTLGQPLTPIGNTRKPDPGVLFEQILNCK